MEIRNLRVIDNDKLQTPDGTVLAPVTYYMDVQLNEEEAVAVPIDADTYATLHSLTADGFVLAEDELEISA